MKMNMLRIESDRIINLDHVHEIRHEENSVRFYFMGGFTTADDPDGKLWKRLEAMAGHYREAGDE
jgi:hypothetical protein